MSEHLSRWFGKEGFEALLARALDRARPRHPALAQLTPFTLVSAGARPIEPTAGRSTDQLTGGGPTGPDDAVAEAFVSVVSETIALLARLIGDDMAVHLIEQVWPAQAPTAAPEVTGQTHHGDAVRPQRETGNVAGGDGATNDKGEGRQQ